jgi:lipopolysaccharide/colanic/teichoic acid biosynthesis glycosyltransferase
MPPDLDHPSSAAGKRVFDIAVSLLALTVASPVLVLVAVAIKLDGPGPVIYRGVRVGRGGAPFRLYKFRTMVPDADQIGPAVTGAGDGRVTGVGRWLRRLKLDELPQFVNVLAGDMSVVGPRPEHPTFVAHYTEEQRALLSVRPGITSPATLEYADEEARLGGEAADLYLSGVLPAKLAIDLEYVRTASTLTDLKIVARTFRLVLGRALRRPLSGGSRPR